MRGYAVYGMALVTAAAGGAAAQERGPEATQESSGGGASVGSTGTPSNATATVSPSTVAEAVMRQDAREATDTGQPAFGVSLGTSIASGDFGTGQDSRVVSVAVGARYAVRTFRISASIPYLNVRSRGILFSGIDSTPIIAAGARPGARRVTRDGLGDLTIGGAYTARESGSTPEIELSGRVKLPTASNGSGLSTGKADVSAGIQVTKTIGKVAPFVSATYRIFGDPAIIDLNDGIAASAGASVGLGDRAVVLFSYHFAEAASRLVRDSHELFAGVSGRLPNSKLRLTGFATAGLSSGAAARSGGVSLSLDF